MKRGIIIAGLALALAVGAIYARARALVLLEQSRGANAEQGIVKLELASRLNPFNNLIIQELSAKYEQIGQPLSAINALRRNPVGESGDEIVVLQLRTGQVAAARRTAAKLPNTAEAAVARASVELEEGNAGAAVSLLDRLGSEPARQLLILTQASLGQSTAAPQSDSEALRALRQGSSDHLFVAQAFYARGLLNSAERLLNKDARDGAAEDYLHARIALDRLNDNKRLHKAKNSITAATKKDPGNRAYHKLALSIYRQLNDPKGIKSEQRLLDELE